MFGFGASSSSASSFLFGVILAAAVVVVVYLHFVSTCFQFFIQDLMLKWKCDFFLRRFHSSP